MTYVELRTLIDKDLSLLPLYHIDSDLDEYLVSVKQDEQEDKFVVQYFDGRDKVRTLHSISGDVHVYVDDTDFLQGIIAELRPQHTECMLALKAARDENKQLRAFVEKHKQEFDNITLIEDVDLFNALMAKKFAIFGIEAAALLASLDARDTL